MSRPEATAEQLSESERSYDDYLTFELKAENQLWGVYEEGGEEKREQISGSSGTST
jgi:hypothetical protein